MFLNNMLLTVQQKAIDSPTIDFCQEIIFKIHVNLGRLLALNVKPKERFSLQIISYKMAIPKNKENVKTILLYSTK